MLIYFIDKLFRKSFETEEMVNNSVALVRQQTIPTERPPHVGEVSAKILRIEGVA
jgi:hypothetical protein